MGNGATFGAGTHSWMQNQYQRTLIYLPLTVVPAEAHGHVGVAAGAGAGDKPDAGALAEVAAVVRPAAAPRDGRGGGRGAVAVLPAPLSQPLHEPEVLLLLAA